MNPYLRHSILLISILLITSGVAFAQNYSVVQDTLTWKVSEYKDVVAGVTGANQSEFITFGTSSVRWSQDNGNVVFDYTVTGTEGTWQAGEIVYHTLRKGRTSEFRFKNSPSGIKIFLNYADSAGVNRTFEFVISEILTQQ